MKRLSNLKPRANLFQQKVKLNKRKMLKAVKNHQMKKKFNLLEKLRLKQPPRNLLKPNKRRNKNLQKKNHQKRKVMLMPKRKRPLLPKNQHQRMVQENKARLRKQLAAHQRKKARKRVKKRSLDQESNLV